MSEQSSCDVFVIFGITGDLAKVMTFRSLYRLEQRKLLDCPIVGVAVDDWSVDQLVERARTSIIGTGEQLDEDVFARLASRLLLRRRATSATTPPTVASARRSRVHCSRCSTWRSRRSCSGPWSRVSPAPGSPKHARVVVEKPFGHDLASAKALADGAAPVHRRVAAPAHRPLSRQDGTRGDPLPPVRQHHARTGVEPQLRRERADHDGGGLRCRGPRSLLRSGRRAARRGGEPPHAGRRGHGDGGTRRRRSRDPQGCADCVVQGGRHRRPGALRARPVRRLPVDRRRAADSTTETYAALRLDIENWRWSGVPFFIRTGKRLPVTQTEVRLVFKKPPSLGFGLRDAASRTGPGGHQARSLHRDSLRARSAARPNRRTARPIQLDMEFSEQGGEGATPYEVLLHAAMVGQTVRFTRQDMVEEAWRIMQPLLDAPPPVHSYAPGSWGPDAASQLVAGHGRWRDPWITQ